MCWEGEVGKNRPKPGCGVLETLWGPPSTLRKEDPRMGKSEIFCVCPGKPETVRFSLSRKSGLRQGPEATAESSGGHGWRKDKAARMPVGVT